MSYVRSTHLIEAAATSDFAFCRNLQPTITYTDVLPIVEQTREIVAGGFALVLTTPYEHIYEVWIQCNAADGGYIIVDYECLGAGVGLPQDNAIFIGQTLVLTDVLSPTDPADPGAFPFLVVYVPGVNDTASFIITVVGTSIL